jgi:dTDP-4-dehydrorhamnose 3,5-epimerase
MHARPLAIPEVLLIDPKLVRDDRGFFSETYVERTFAASGVPARFVQDNHSLSRQAGVVRGLHFQTDPHAQGKLVRVVRGSILDVAVDIRHGSPSFGRHVAVVLSAQNWQQLWVPRGFAHGFCTLEPDTEVFYKVTDYYAPECDRSILWNDPALGIAWPQPASGVTLSQKDAAARPLAEHPAYFTFDPAPRGSQA